MIVLEVIVRLVGVLFMFGALAVVRAVKLDKFLDLALAGITAKPVHPREAVRRHMMLAGGALSGLSGAAMVTLSLWALPLLIASAAAQIMWLWWAKTNYPPEDEAEIRGRQQSRNAAIFTLAMFALTLGLGLDHRLADWSAPMGLASLGLAAVLGLGYFFADQLRGPGNRRGSDASEPEIEEAEDLPMRVRLAPAHNCPSLYDADNYTVVRPHRFLNPALADRILAWEDQLQDGAEVGDDGLAVFADAAALAAFEAEGEAIAAELREIFGPNNVEGPVILARSRVR